MFETQSDSRRAVLELTRRRHACSPSIHRSEISQSCPPLPKERISAPSCEQIGQRLPVPGPEFFPGPASEKTSAGRWKILANAGNLPRVLLRDVVRGANGENALVATHQKRPLEEPGTLVMEEIFVPAILDQLWNDDDNAPIGMF